MGLISIYIPDAAEEKMVETLGDKEAMKIWCKMRLLDNIRDKFGEDCLFDRRKLKRK